MNLLLDFWEKLIGLFKNSLQIKNFKNIKKFYFINDYDQTFKTKVYC